MEYNIYIDESGDEGLNRGSKFFILTAVMVKKEKDLEISKMVDRIKENLNLSIKNQLHWKAIKGYSKKIMIMDNASKSEISIINIVIDTRKINFIESGDIYNHFSGYLYERICWFVRDRQAIANINISSRGENLTKANLVRFLKTHESKFKIDYQLINSIKIIPNGKRKLLQLADCCCSALGQALKYNNNMHRDYIVLLKPKLYHYNKKYLGYGLKYVPGNTAYAKEFDGLIIYLDKKNSELSPD